MKHHGGANDEGDGIPGRTVASIKNHAAARDSSQMMHSNSTHLFSSAIAIFRAQRNLRKTDSIKIYHNKEAALR